jgi:hypothetical protein
VGIEARSQVRLVLTVVAAVWACQAVGQECAPREHVIAGLESRYGERFDGGGLVSERTIYEVWVAESGTWTILRTTAGGVSCIMASGTRWRKPSPEPEGEDG